MVPPKYLSRAACSGKYGFAYIFCLVVLLGLDVIVEASCLEKNDVECGIDPLERHTDTGCARPDNADIAVDLPAFVQFSYVDVHGGDFRQSTLKAYSA